MRLKRGNVERIVSTEAEINKLKKHGFKEVSENKSKKDNAAAGEDMTDFAENTSVEELDTKELREMAKEKGLKGYNSMGREDLLEALKEVVV